MTKRFIVPMGERFKEELKDEVEKETEMFCVMETIPGPPLVTSSDAKAEAEFVGATALWKRGEPGMRHTNYSIVLEKLFWSKGYGKEITRFMVDYAFRHLNMHRISLEVFDGNDRAIAVYQKCGFAVEVRQREAHWSNVGWKDIIQMGILMDDWNEKTRKGT